jgi:4-amino-4-deoxy-L-arabinose transferase-like glycosyltransferase
MATPWRLFWLLVLAGHAVAATAWWGMMPGGFPPAHPRFWANRVAPVAVLTVVALAVATARRRRFDLLRPDLISGG